ncbi:nitrate/sulfonate/bicarbonate transporter ATP-binding protein [Acetobacter nitrogenifigens DSM 23921 = NBRC 105050]|uniref:ABC transporter ATP-binding protein n=1 Tax=Acetobacter nitrogenifigens DSM 23921 = NBRC 105050 TaxID=1120919 RepID=A0A511X6C7_9PROT|nr:nitrate/sulfonate/bicarbonate ABC transporter ATP-binding protein [Acetobacter nitrogenifigens]GBQ96003.1 nitrate/sulfonate/bicarbonate transporter ATP-binding protein [Acetobacter nitrogenifigens DSM 23921 = NBRC 105050]GEN58475.1 ABC transporter ATP-binding protein [Acetobacter nitrogenifigens DSM 23921 = NBRC 105050]
MPNAPKRPLFSVAHETSLAASERGEETLIRVAGVKQSFHQDANADFLVLDDVSMTVRSGEVVGLLGRSGSGKSTLLRIMAGLVAPTAGSVFWHDQPLLGPVPGIGIVFQSYALFPWLTVQENVELGLAAHALPRAEKAARTSEVIDLMGLSGNENAWPRELSGDMLQRTGLARALAGRPDLLVMDEPFAALDVLTAENLRTDLMELWDERKLPLKAMMIVTHSIEEAVLMCDRVLVFAANPGRIEHELLIDLPHPRNRDDPAFRELVDHIYSLMTRRTPVVSEADLNKARPASPGPTHMPLPAVTVGSMLGLIEALAAPPLGGHADLPLLASRAQLELDDLFPLVETLQLLGLAELEDGDILLTHEGQHFAGSDADERKAILRHAFLNEAPLMKSICAALDERPNHTVSVTRFRDELQESMSPAYAAQTLQTIVQWARYAELFDFDEEGNEFLLTENTLG